MTLPGCAARRVEVPGPVREVPVTVTIKDTPPADLLKCPETPEGAPEDAIAQIPTSARAAMIRLAKAFRVNTGRLRRLMNWHQPGACPEPSVPREAAR